MSGIVGSRFNIRGSGVVGKLGTDGQVFTSAGAGTSAVFEAAAGGGKIGQVVVAQNMQGSSIATHSQSFVTTGATAAITPAAVTSKILIRVHSGTGMVDTDSNHWYRTLYRDATDLGSGALFFHSQYTSEGNMARVEVIEWLDSPSSTSEIDYACFHKTADAGVTGYWCWAGSYWNMTLMEVLA